MTRLFDFDFLVMLTFSSFFVLSKTCLFDAVFSAVRLVLTFLEMVFLSLLSSVIARFLGDLGLCSSLSYFKA